MASSAVARASVRHEETSSASAHPPRCLRIRRDGGSWRVREDGLDRIGGIFVSLASAVDFARGELRGMRGAYVVLELGGDDERS
jgi:hypothetical protein